jgi:hypothetical protein
VSRRGETVLEKLNRLVGAPRELFLKKWVRWVKGIIPPNIDPNVIVGEPRITEDTVIKLFKEYCQDLEEGECYNKLVEVFLHSKATGKKVFERDFIADFEVKSKISEAVTKALKLDFEVNPAVADQLYKTIFEERNAEKACELIKEDVKKRWLLLDVEPPAEELKLAEETCSKIRELVARRAPPIEWWKVLEPAFKTREEIEPSIKPYINKLRFWGIDRDMEHLVRLAKAEELRVLAGDRAIERVTGITVRYLEDLKPADLVTAAALRELVETPIGIYPSLKVSQAQELIYVNKFHINKVETPLLCIYLTTKDYIVACDRPAILVAYGEEETAVAPIPLIKMIKELYKRGVIVEEGKT